MDILLTALLSAPVQSWVLGQILGLLLSFRVGALKDLRIRRLLKFSSSLFYLVGLILLIHLWYTAGPLAGLLGAAAMVLLTAIFGFLRWRLNRLHRG